MLPSTDEEKQEIRNYFLSQSSDASVSYLQKMYAETIAGHRHEVWDVHASDGRWWIVTNPTNLYSQDQFPNLDLAVTFHMGLCLRIPRTDRVPMDGSQIMPFGDILQQVRKVGEDLSEADTLQDFRAVGVNCRETLIAMVQGIQASAEWPEPHPGVSDVKAWADTIMNSMFPGKTNAARRALFKNAVKQAMDFSNWLTHAKSATWYDAETAHQQVDHVVSLLLSPVLRFLRGVPDFCPECGSRHLSPETGHHEDDPDVEYQRPVCEECDWHGKAVRLAERPADMFVCEGQKNDDCLTMATPLTGLVQPE